MASLWHFFFRACILTPRGGPRGEPPRPSGCQPTTSSSYIMGVRFHFIFFSPLAPFPAHRAPRPLRSHRRRSPPERCSRRTSVVASAALKVSAAQRSTDAPLPPLLRAFFGGFRLSSSPAFVDDHKLAAPPASLFFASPAASGEPQCSFALFFLVFQILGR